MIEEKRRKSLTFMYTNSSKKKTEKLSKSTIPEG